MRFIRENENCAFNGREAWVLENCAFNHTSWGKWLIVMAVFSGG